MPEKTKNYFTFFNSKRTGSVLAVSIILLFLVFALIRLYPYENTLAIVLSEKGDDWSTYARFALDIKHHGLLLNTVQEDYFNPAGFLYNYFLAFCFVVFGENNVPVYIIQCLLLGISITLIYHSFRNQMKAGTSLLFLLTLFVFALIDVYKMYSFRLLSENLALFTISVFFYFFIRGMERNKLRLLIGASIFLGLSVLLRPNIFPFCIIMMMIVSFYFLKQKRAGYFKAFLIVLVFGLSMSILAIRNRFVSGNWTFLPTQGISFMEHAVQQPAFSIGYCIKKILFCFGFLSPLEPTFSLRPHWTMMWLGYFVFLFIRLKEKNKFTLWEISVHLFIFFYYGVLIFVAPTLGNYGFRHLIPTTLIVLPFAFMAFDKLNPKKHFH